MTARTDTPPALTAADQRFLAGLGSQLRADSIRCSTAAGSGHPTSAMSAADLMAVLLARHLRYDWDSPGEPGNDHLIFSKGHPTPLPPWGDVATGSLGDMDAYRRRAEAFGCTAVVIDGHDITQIDQAWPRHGTPGGRP
jgi:transketolase